MAQRYRNPFKGRPHQSYRRPTTRFDGQAPNNEQYTINQTWGALKLCWKGYRIAKVKDDLDGMAKYAWRIQTLQYELDLPVSEFPDVFEHLRDDYVPPYDENQSSKCTYP